MSCAYLLRKSGTNETLSAMVRRPTRGGGGRARGDTAWFRTGCAGALGFFALEAVNRTPGVATSLHASDADRGTTRRIGFAYALACELPVLARRRHGPELPRGAGPLGILVQASGLVLRTYSMRTLGGSYTRTLRTAEQQQLVDTGPYRWVRHPGYTGSLLTWIGYVLTSRSVPALLAVSALLGRLYYQRIAAEEVMLAREFPGYATYSSRTNKLVPLIW
jgi:protein-S-isoprenylcysteine O-methyltransferase